MPESLLCSLVALAAGLVVGWTTDSCSECSEDTLLAFLLDILDLMFGHFFLQFPSRSLSCNSFLLNLVGSNPMARRLGGSEELLVGEEVYPEGGGLLSGDLAGVGGISIVLARYSELLPMLSLLVLLLGCLCILPNKVPGAESLSSQSIRVSRILLIALLNSVILALVES